jgi:hypothetical protein
MWAINYLVKRNSIKYKQDKNEIAMQQSHFFMSIKK